VGENRAAEAARAATASPLLDQSIEGAQNVLFNVTHSGNIQLRELDMAARVIAEMVDPSANIIFGTVVDARVGDEIHMTVIATGFSPRAATIDDHMETSRNIRDYGLQGVSSMDDAELPAFLRRNIRSLNAGRPVGEGSVARLAERR
jgi:cell division protein FtsZ